MKLKIKTLLSLSFAANILSTEASYTWTVNETADDTATISAAGSVVDGKTAEYFRYDISDLGNQILSGTFTENGISVDYAVTLIEYNDLNTGVGTTPSGNDESFALYEDGQLDLFTFLARSPTGGDPANLTRGFKFDFYDLGTLGTTNTQMTTGTFSFGSPLDSNAITKLASGENYEMTWLTGGTGYAFDPDNQINETISTGLTQFNVDPDIDDVLTSNYGLFSANTLTSFELRRQDILSSNGRTGVRSGITLGGLDLILPNGASVPEPNSVILLLGGSFIFLIRRRLKK